MLYTRKRERKGWLWSMLAFAVLLGFFAGGSSGSQSYAQTVSMQAVKDLQPMSFNASELEDIPATKTEETPMSMVSATPMASTTEKRYVYDEGENKLMYNRVTGMVFSEKGVVYNHDSQPLTYDDNTEQFEDSIKRRMELVERSTHGLQNYYLMFGKYKVRSIGIHDELYVVTIKAKTDFNKGKAYDMLITRVWVSNPWYLYLLGLYGSYEYYDLYGHEIEYKYLETRLVTLLVGTGTLGYGSVLTKFEKWGTVKDLLDEIVFLMEIAPPDGSPMGEFALDTVTGAFLRDDRGQKIRIKEGQLIDPMGWPLIGADARPLWWREDVHTYTTHKGELLECGENNVLKDKDGFIAHSVISNVIAGTRIYLIYVNILDGEGTVDPSISGKFLIPATAKTISISPYEAEFYDMNGKLIPEWEIIEPEVSVDDRKEHWPEEFPEPEWLIGLKAAFDAIVSFFREYGLWIVIGIIVIVSLPITAPLIFFILKLILKGVVFGISLPFKFIAWLARKKE